MKHTNEFGFEEWWTEDREGRTVECYADKFVEIHIKRPVCECGCEMSETETDVWKCPSCGCEYSYDELYRNYEPDTYDCDAGTIQDDYGERKYEDIPLRCGSEEVYQVYRRLKNR